MAKSKSPCIARSVLQDRAVKLHTPGSTVELERVAKLVFLKWPENFRKLELVGNNLAVIGIHFFFADGFLLLIAKGPLQALLGWGALSLS